MTYAIVMGVGAVLAVRDETLQSPHALMLLIALTVFVIFCKYKADSVYVPKYTDEELSEDTADE